MKEEEYIMDIIVKALLTFWGIILISIVLKIVTSYLPNNIDFSLPSSFSTNSSLESQKTTTTDNSTKNKNLIYFPMEEQYGLKLQGYQGCIKNFAGGKFEKGYNYSTSSMCMNGECELIVEFRQKIPKKMIILQQIILIRAQQNR